MGTVIGRPGLDPIYWTFNIFPTSLYKTYGVRKFIADIILKFSLSISYDSETKPGYYCCYLKFISFVLAIKSKGLLRFCLKSSSVSKLSVTIFSNLLSIVSCKSSS